jgi:hypothetical protein
VENKLNNDVRFLKAYAVIATLLGMVFFLSAFVFQNKNQKFDEIDVERINIVEKNGKLDMVISNQERQHPGISNGKIIKRSGPRPPGMIFFNQAGDEMGGLIFGDNGGNGHFGSFTFDKVKNDQALGFRYLESDNGTYESGLQMWQPPNIPTDQMMANYDAANKIPDEAKRKAAIQALIDANQLTTNRLFLGKRRDNTLALAMYDVKGKLRIRMQVTPDGTPKLEFLDEAGKVVYALPEASKSEKLRE